MTSFTLEIKLGNDAMQEPWAIAQALYVVADKIVDIDSTANIRSQKIYDYNGNHVGEAKIVKERK